MYPGYQGFNSPMLQNLPNLWALMAARQGGQGWPGMGYSGVPAMRPQPAPPMMPQQPPVTTLPAVRPMMPNGVPPLNLDALRERLANGLQGRVLGTMHEGGPVDKTGLYRLKKGEHVLTSDQISRIGTNALNFK